MVGRGEAEGFAQANLVSIHSEEEENFLNELSGEGTYYIGGIIIIQTVTDHCFGMTVLR